MNGIGKLIRRSGHGRKFYVLPPPEKSLTGIERQSLLLLREICGEQMGIEAEAVRRHEECFQKFRLVLGRINRHLIRLGVGTPLEIPPAVPAEEIPDEQP